MIYALEVMVYLGIGLGIAMTGESKKASNSSEAFAECIWIGLMMMLWPIMVVALGVRYILP